MRPIVMETLKLPSGQVLINTFGDFVPINKIGLLDEYGGLEVTKDTLKQRFIISFGEVGVSLFERVLSSFENNK